MNSPIESLKEEVQSWRKTKKFPQEKMPLKLKEKILAMCEQVKLSPKTRTVT